MPQTTVYWIGTGSALNPHLGNTSFTLSGGNGRCLLVDCGALVTPRLLEFDLAQSITDVALTHMHSDHIGGIETFAFYQHFELNRRGMDRPNLHLPSEKFANVLWEHALKAGMGLGHDAEGEATWPTLETYFNVCCGTQFKIDGLPSAEFIRVSHVAHMENYGILFDNGLYYSGDTTEPPPNEPTIIFQDCATGAQEEDEVHITYQELCESLTSEVKAKTHLVHLDRDHTKIDPLADGFAGFVMPGSTFELE